MGACLAASAQEPSDAPNAAEPRILARAIAGWVAPKVRSYVTERVRSGKKGTDSFSMRERIRVVLKQPDKMRVEVTLAGPDGSYGGEYLVISDGRRVWGYRPGVKRYSEVPYVKFRDNPDVLTSVGFFTGFSVAAGLSEPEGRDEAAIMEVLLAGEPVAGERVQIGGRDRCVYKVTFEEGAPPLEITVDPATHTLERFAVAGETEGASFSLTERLVEHTSPKITPETFRFKPPKGVRKVKTLGIGAV